MPAPPARPDRTIGRYQILDEIGRGGFGIVYKANDPKLKRAVALKLLTAGEGASEEDIQRFMREAESAAKLHHPNIVPIHELDVHEGRHFFTMDLIEGPTLSKLIGEDDITARRAVEILQEVARAVHHAHEHGIVHRDIKPDNILIARDGRPMVTEFGLAKRVEGHTRLTRSGATMGTPQYMPPEQARGQVRRIDARSDVYALGAVLYEMITGRPPFEGATIFEIIEKVVYEDADPPRRQNRACPPDVETICMKCIEKDARRRYQSAEELADDCRRFLDGEPITARPASFIYRTRKGLAKHKAIAAVVVVAGAALLVLAALKGVIGVTVLGGAALLALAGLSYVRIVRERNEAVRQRELAEKARLSEARARRKAQEALKVEERWRHDLDAVREIQSNLLPPKIPQIPGYDMFPFYRSAREVGGDYYDFIPIDNERLAVLVADVSGKGIPGAMVMATTRTLFHLLAPQCCDAAEIMRQVNRRVAKDIRQGMFVTVLLAVLNVHTRTMSVCSAGHNPMVVFRERSGRCELVNPNGIALGFDQGPIFDRMLRERTVHLEPGDRVVMYTDGVVEMMNPRKEEYGDERFYGFVRDHARMRSKDFVTMLVRDLDIFKGKAQQHDDMLISTFRVLA